MRSFSSFELRIDRECYPREIVIAVHEVRVKYPKRVVIRGNGHVTWWASDYVNDQEKA